MIICPVMVSSYSALIAGQGFILVFSPQPRKPDPAGAERIARQLRVATRDFLFLGDSSVDMETARRAGMVPVGAGWGFRTHQELQDSGAAAIIDFPLDLLSLLESFRARSPHPEE